MKKFRFTKKSQKRQQGQPENREEITPYMREQMGTPSFETVAADGCQDSVPRLRQIFVQESVAEIPHGHVRMLHRGPENITLPNHTHCTVQGVHTAPQVLQVTAGRRHGGGFVVGRAITVHRLIRANNQGTRVPARDNPGLFNGQFRGQIGDVQGVVISFETGFIKLCRINGEIDPRARQDIAPGGAGRCQYEGAVLFQVSPSSRRKWSWIIVAAVSSMDFLETLMIGQLWRENRRRASLISLVTISKST